MLSLLLHVFKGGILILCFFTPNWASALSDVEIETKIDGVLLARHQTEGADWWRALGPRTPVVVIAMYGKKVRALEKSRLIYALGFFPESGEAIEFLEQMAKEEKNVSFRRAAIQSYGNALGAEGLPLMEEMMADSNPRIRATAAEFLAGLSSTPKVKSRVDRFLKEEKSSWVRQKVQRSRESAARPKKKVTIDAWKQIVGDWSGVWVYLDAKRSVVSQPVRLSVRIGSKVKKTLQLKMSWSGATKKFRSVSGQLFFKGDRWTSRLPLGPTKASKPQSTEWLREAGRQANLLLAAWPGDATKLILTRSIKE